MTRLVWKPFALPGFILALLLAGCGERQPAIGEALKQAEGLMETGQVDSAIVVLERCAERNPNRVDVLEPLAFAYSTKGDSVLAGIIFKRIAELVPSQPEYLLYAGNSLVAANDTDGAVDCFKEYLAARPSDRPVWVSLAGLQAQAGRLSEALEAWLAAEQLEPRPVQQVAIGELYLRTQNLAQAQAWFARALEGDPEARDEALLGLLETALRARQFPEAEALLQQIDKEYPGRVDGSPLAAVRTQLGEWRRRREAAKAALADLEPKPVEVAAETPEPEPPAEVPPTPPPAAAETVLPPPAEVPQAEPPPPPSPPAGLELARQLRGEGRLNEAISVYKEALIQNDNQPWAWAELSETYLQAGEDRWAQATASEAMRRDPENPAFRVLFLRAAQRTYAPDRFVQELENAYRRFPNQPEIILALARAFVDLDNPRNAQLLFRRFLQLAPPDHPQREAVQAELDGLGR